MKPKPTAETPELFLPTIAENETDVIENMPMNNKKDAKKEMKGMGMKPMMAKADSRGFNPNFRM